MTSATLRELQMPVAIEAREFTMGGLIRAIVLARYAEPKSCVIETESRRFSMARRPMTQ